MSALLGPFTRQLNITPRSRSFVSHISTHTAQERGGRVQGSKKKDEDEKVDFASHSSALRAWSYAHKAR